MLFLQAWYNTKGYHAAPTFLNVLNNIILRSKAAEKGLNASRFGKIRSGISFYVTDFHCCVILFLFLLGPLVIGSCHEFSLLRYIIPLTTPSCSQGG